MPVEKMPEPSITSASTLARDATNAPGGCVSRLRDRMLSSRRSNPIAKKSSPAVNCARRIRTVESASVLGSMVDA